MIAKRSLYFTDALSKRMRDLGIFWLSEYASVVSNPQYSKNSGDCGKLEKYPRNTSNTNIFTGCKRHTIRLTGAYAQHGPRMKSVASQNFPNADPRQHFR